MHFQGFRSNHDEWVPKAHIRLTATKAQIVQLNARVAWMGNTTGLNADENSWEIDEIVGKKHCGGTIKYLVKWDGWEAEHNTWEPKRNLPAEVVAGWCEIRG